MSRKILLLSDFIEAIENKMISIVSVENKTKISIDITETSQIAPEKFIESIKYLDKTIFKDTIDFFYEFTGKKDILIECEMKNMYVKEYYRVECVVNNGMSVDDIDKKFSETIFDRMDKKLAMQTE